MNIFEFIILDDGIPSDVSCEVKSILDNCKDLDKLLFPKNILEEKEIQIKKEF